MNSLEMLVHVPQAGISKQMNYDEDGRMYARYHHHGQEVKKIVDFHLLMRMFVLAQRPQMSFFPSDVKWIGDTLLVKRNFIEEALDDVFQKVGIQSARA